jgi:ATP-binding cassette subfamily B protein
MQQFEERDYTQRFSWSLWKKILRYAKEYHKDLFKLIVVMGVTAGCDVLFPLMTSYAIDHFIPNLDHPGGTEGLPGFIVMYLLVLVVQVFQSVGSRLAARLDKRVKR